MNANAADATPKKEEEKPSPSDLQKDIISKTAEAQGSFPAATVPEKDQEKKGDFQVTPDAYDEEEAHVVVGDYPALARSKGFFRQHVILKPVHRFHYVHTERDPSLYAKGLPKAQINTKTTAVQTALVDWVPARLFVAPPTHQDGRIKEDHEPFDVPLLPLPSYAAFTAPEGVAPFPAAAAGAFNGAQQAATNKLGTPKVVKMHVNAFTGGQTPVDYRRALAADALWRHSYLDYAQTVARYVGNRHRFVRNDISVPGPVPKLTFFPNPHMFRTIAALGRVPIVQDGALRAWLAHPQGTPIAMTIFKEAMAKVPVPESVTSHPIAKLERTDPFYEFEIFETSPSIGDSFFKTLVAFFTAGVGSRLEVKEHANSNPQVAAFHAAILLALLPMDCFSADTIIFLVTAFLSQCNGVAQPHAIAMRMAAGNPDPATPAYLMACYNNRSFAGVGGRARLPVHPLPLRNLGDVARSFITNVPPAQINLFAINNGAAVNAAAFSAFVTGIQRRVVNNISELQGGVFKRGKVDSFDRARLRETLGTTIMHLYHEVMRFPQSEHFRGASGAVVPGRVHEIDLASGIALLNRNYKQMTSLPVRPFTLDSAMFNDLGNLMDLEFLAVQRVTVNPVLALSEEALPTINHILDLYFPKRDKASDDRVAHLLTIMSRVAVNDPLLNDLRAALPAVPGVFLTNAGDSQSTYVSRGVYISPSFFQGQILHNGVVRWRGAPPGLMAVTLDNLLAASPAFSDAFYKSVRGAGGKGELPMSELLQACVRYGRAIHIPTLHEVGINVSDSDERVTEADKVIVKRSEFDGIARFRIEDLKLNYTPYTQGGRPHLLNVRIVPANVPYVIEGTETVSRNVFAAQQQAPQLFERVQIEVLEDVVVNVLRSTVTYLP